jgi:4-hydroxy-tetrahydrodipicolinate reductase
MTNVSVLGVSGRMGRCLVRAIRESPDFVLSGALASPASAALGRDAGEVAQAGPVAVEVTARREIALANADIAIDFTLPEAVPENLAAVERAGIPWVIGITGLDAGRNAQVRKASERLPVLVAPNMSLAVNLLFGLAGRAAASLPADYDVEILEAHHRHKADAPSGTALRLGEIVAGSRGGTLAEQAVYGRLGKSVGRGAGGHRLLEACAAHRRRAPCAVRGHRRNVRTRAPDDGPHDLCLRRARRALAGRDRPALYG